MHRIKLGNYAHISISVQSLKESSRFYELLGFKHVYGNNEPQPWSLFTDGKVNVHLYESSFVSPALHYFSAHMNDKVSELVRLGIRPEEQKSKDGQRVQHTFSDPNEFPIMLMHYSDEDMPHPAGTSHSHLGTFGELSITTESVEISVGFWKQLDFAILNTGETPYPWAILSDGVMMVGFHQTASFETPALTYFTPDIPERIEQIRSASIDIVRELKDARGNSQGAVLQAPEGQLLFVLKGHV